MKSNYCFLSSIVAVLLFLLTTVGWTGTFIDNFDDGNADGWTIAENAASEWQVMDGGYHGSIADSTESIALTGEADWDVESIEVKVRAAEGEWLALVWRYQDLSNFDSGHHARPLGKKPQIPFAGIQRLDLDCPVVESVENFDCRNPQVFFLRVVFFPLVEPGECNRVLVLRGTVGHWNWLNPNVRKPETSNIVSNPAGSVEDAGG